MTKSRPVVVLATNNVHKVGEIRAILRKAGLPVQLKTLNDFPRRRPVIEDRPTIEGNATKKAAEVAKATGHLSLADDTGLFIHALGGRPGVYSARFAGPGCNFQDNNRKVLRLMKKTPPARRTAVFRCIAALARPDGKVFRAEGRLAGRIAPEIRGEKGFGYDPVFFVPAFRKTFAEMTAAQKNRISHRGRAFRKVPKLLRQALRGWTAR